MSRGDSHEERDRESATPVSGTVAMVVDWLLNEITSGRLPAGSIVRDLDVARALGVSRTPVREAIVLLRSAGALEVVASRYTRVTVLDGATAGQAHLVWVALLGVAVEEVIASDAPFDLAGLEAAHAAARLAADEPHAFVSATTRFFEQLLGQSSNPHLLRAVGSVVPVIQLALVSLPIETVTDDALRAQAMLLDAARRRDLDHARAAVALLRDLDAREGSAAG